MLSGAKTGFVAYHIPINVLKEGDSNRKLEICRFKCEIVLSQPVVKEGIAFLSIIINSTLSRFLSIRANRWLLGLL